MRLYILPLKRIVSITYVLFFQIVLALTLPIQEHQWTRELGTRGAEATPLQNKRAISSAAGAIGGGAVGLILLALFIGLGSAAIAIIGSIEWREFRDRKKPRQTKGDEEKARDRNLEIAGQELQSVTTTSTTETVMSDPQKVGIETQAPRKSRLTLKSFKPMDFHRTWLHVSHLGKP